MDVLRDSSGEKWPPGTVLLEDLIQGGEVVLQPRPSVDPNDPLNWTQWRKFLNFILACAYAIFVFANIGVTTVTWGQMNMEVGFSYEVLNDSYAAGCAALAVGGPLLIPFALKFGRRPVYVISTAAQLAFAIWSAKIETVGDLIAVNTLNCLFGALAEVIVQMTVADVFFVHQRGRMNSLYCWAMTIGTSLAPIAGGYIARNHGWRWVWWWMAISFSVMLPIYIFGFEESKYDKVYDGFNTTDIEVRRPIGEKGDNENVGTAPSISTAKEEKLDPERRHANDVEIDRTIPMKPYWQRLALWSTSPGPFSQFLRHGYQPLLVFAFIPAVSYMCLVYSIMNATLTVNITLMSQYLYGPPYNFDSAQVGLMSLPSFIGTSLGLLICGPLSDWSILYLSRRNNGVYEPEMRLWVIAAFIPFVPAGLFMFGFGLANGSSWPIVAVGSGLLAFAFAPASSIALTYLTDGYTEIIADAVVALTVIRNVIGTIFVFAIAPWIQGIGMKNVYIMLGVLNIVILSSVFVFIFYGKKLRIKTTAKYHYYSQLQYNPRGI